MSGNSRPLATPEIGKPLGYEHFQIHSKDALVLKQLGYVPPYPQTPLARIEVLTVGMEADIMDWFQANWTYSIVFSVIYVILIVIGQRIMKNREKFDLRRPLIAWSGFLALYSIISSVRALHELGTVQFKHGFYHTVCNPSCFYGVPGLWALAFVLSKVLELGDTAFIVLRKQPLIFLHWYHHVTVMCYSWFTYAEHAAPGRWYTIMNLFVHAFMYSYYTARAMRLRIPRSVMMSITILQLSQMVMGLFVTVYASYVRSQGISCHFPPNNMFWAFAMYLSYFLLFLNYFYHAYIKPKPRQQQTANGAVSKQLMNGANGVNGASHKGKDGIHMNGDSVQANGHTKKTA